MPTGLTRAAEQLWLRWVLTTTLGSLLGGAGSGSVESLVETRFAEVTAPLLGALALGGTCMIAFGVQGGGDWSRSRDRSQALPRPVGWWVARSAEGCPGRWVGPDAKWAGVVLALREVESP
jgi:hypothetical protein